MTDVFAELEQAHVRHPPQPPPAGLAERGQRAAVAERHDQRRWRRDGKAPPAARDDRGEYHDRDEGQRGHPCGELEGPRGADADRHGHVPHDRIKVDVAQSGEDIVGDAGDQQVGKHPDQPPRVLAASEVPAHHRRDRLRHAHDEARDDALVLHRRVRHGEDDRGNREREREPRTSDTAARDEQRAERDGEVAGGRGPRLAHGEQPRRERQVGRGDLVAVRVEDVVDDEQRAAGRGDIAGKPDQRPRVRGRVRDGPAHEDRPDVHVGQMDPGHPPGCLGLEGRQAQGPHRSAPAGTGAGTGASSSPGPIRTGSDPSAPSR